MQEIFIRHEKSGKLLILMSESTTPRNRVNIQMTMMKETRTTLETVPAVARAGLSGSKAVNRMRMMMTTTNMLQTIHLSIIKTVIGQAQGSKVVKCIQTMMKGTRTTLEEVSAVARAGLSGSKAVNRMRTRAMTLDGGVATLAAALALADHCGSVHMRTRTTLEARAGLSESKAVNRMRMMMQMRDILDDAMIIVIILNIGGQLMTSYL